MRKQILLISVLLSFSVSAFSQNYNGETDFENEPKKNAIYFEFFGNNGIYSFNYERSLYIAENLKEQLALSLGFNAPFSIFPSKIPLELKYLNGTKHSFELGAGLTLGTANWFDELEPDKFVGSYFVLRTGYRYSNKGLLVRLAPMVHLPKTWSSSIWFGASVGYSF